MPNKRLSVLNTIVLLLLTVGVFELTNIDLWVQDFFYFRETQSWLIDRNNTVLRLVFYSGIKTLFIAVVLSLVFSLIFLRKLSWVRNNKRSLIIIVLSCVAIPLAVGLIKDVTNMPCPNQLLFFDGSYEKIGLFEVMSNDTRAHTSCYPAGHASGGFALLSLLLLVNQPKSKKTIFLAVMLLAWGIASYKMLIGDHFLSHTLVTMLLAWLMILFIATLVEKFTRIREENLHPE